MLWILILLAAVKFKKSILPLTLAAERFAQAKSVPEISPLAVSIFISWRQSTEDSLIFPLV